MSINDQIMEIYLSKALYFYDFDLETGIIEKDIIDKRGNNYTRLFGMESPCSFDDLIDCSFDNKTDNVILVNKSDRYKLCRTSFIDAYNAGERTLEVVLYFPRDDAYHRISYYIIPDEDGKKPRVYACCYDITADEKNRKNVYGDLQSAKSDIEDIIASAQIGIWYIFLFDNEKPRMRVTPKMKEIIGITQDNLTEEEIYEAWYSRVKKSSLPSVNASVSEMMEKGFSENTYTWIHPTKGELFVRCGGTATYVEGKGYVLRGYHSDVTETVTSETKQKQLLADALEEVSKQKKLLQEALDNYKEADYDRRRDFLTGLRNRQDMFEFLQDALSGKRENIKSMFMMDIDNFKLLNDHYGHVFGDECLKKIGKAFNEYGNHNNIYFYRYGGEEILGICFDEIKSADVIAGELVKMIYDLDIKRSDMPFGVVTISLGYTTDNSRYEKMIDKADAAMYKAKEYGKNRAVCYEKI